MGLFDYISRKKEERETEEYNNRALISTKEAYAYSRNGDTTFTPYFETAIYPNRFRIQDYVESCSKLTIFKLDRDGDNFEEDTTCSTSKMYKKDLTYYPSRFYSIDSEQEETIIRAFLHMLEKKPTKDIIGYLDNYIIFTDGITKLLTNGLLRECDDKYKTYKEKGYSVNDAKKLALDFIKDTKSKLKSLNSKYESYRIRADQEENRKQNEINDLHSDFKDL